MINSIVSRHNRFVPYSKTEICIIRSATKLFLENGYTKTTLKIIEADSGIEFAALKTFCDRNFTLDKKVALILNSMLML